MQWKSQGKTTVRPISFTEQSPSVYIHTLHAVEVQASKIRCDVELSATDSRSGIGSCSQRSRLLLILLVSHPDLAHYHWLPLWYIYSYAPCVLFSHIKNKILEKLILGVRLKATFFVLLLPRVVPALVLRRKVLSLAVTVITSAVVAVGITVFLDFDYWTGHISNLLAVVWSPLSQFNSDEASRSGQNDQRTEETGDTMTRYWSACRFYSFNSHCKKISSYMPLIFFSKRALVF